MPNKEFATRLVSVLHEVDQRPRSFFGENVPPVVNFLWGIQLAVSALDIYHVYADKYLETLSEKGYEINTGHVYNQMKDDVSEEMIAKILEIEVETWKKVINVL